MDIYGHGVANKLYAQDVEFEILDGFFSRACEALNGSNGFFVVDDSPWTLKAVSNTNHAILKTARDQDLAEVLVDPGKDGTGGNDETHELTPESPTAR